MFWIVKGKQTEENDFSVLKILVHAESILNTLTVEFAWVF